MINHGEFNIIYDKKSPGWQKCSMEEESFNILVTFNYLKFKVTYQEMQIGHLSLI